MPFISSLGGTYGFEGIGGSSLYPFTSHTFTTAGVTGTTGPTLTQVRSAYSAAPWASNTEFLNMSVGRQGIQRWTVPASGSYTIEVAGAQGGPTSSFSGGQGARTIGTFSLTGGSILQILVGQMGSSGTSGGGGGGSFVVTAANDPIIIAGGGGGAEFSSHSTATANKPGAITTSGNPGTAGNTNTPTSSGGTAGGGGGTSTQYPLAGAGGGGLTGNGEDARPQSGTAQARGGLSFTNGGVGGLQAGSGGVGGFGGGGGADWNYWTGGGGGGGYSGGGGGVYYGAGGGGGSFAGGTSQTNTAGFRAGAGYVTITKL
jgi:hypothetical protein